MKWRFLVDVNFDSLLLVSKQSKTIGQPLITAFLYTLLTTVIFVRWQMAIAKYLQSF